MQDFRKGTFKTFVTTHFVTENDKTYLYLTDGEIYTYRVIPYQYQIDLGNAMLNQKVECYIQDVDAFGRPTLRLKWIDVLNDCFPEPNIEYSFTISKINQDENTGQIFLELSYAFGTYHRFYLKNGLTSNEFKIGDEIVLLLKDIKKGEKNKANLELELLQKHDKNDSTIKTSDISSTLITEGPEYGNVFNFGNENETLEFKSTLIYTPGILTPNIDKQSSVITKTLASFMNNKGGTLYIGVNDSGYPVGIERDFKDLNTSQDDNFTYQENIDGYENKIRNIVKRELGQIANGHITELLFETIDGKTVCKIVVEQASTPIFQNGIKLWVRRGNTSDLLRKEAITNFILTRAGLQPITSDQVNSEIEEETRISEAENTIEVAPKRRSETLEFKQPDYKNEDVWRYISINTTNNEYTFERNIDKDNSNFNIAIPKSLKTDGRIVLCSSEGHINSVVPNNFAKKANGKLKEIGKEYKNALNLDVTRVDNFIADANDYIVLESVDDANQNLVKIHRLSDVRDQPQLNAQGNRCLKDAELTHCFSINAYHAQMVSELIFTQNQRTASNGVNVNSMKYKETLLTYRKIKELYTNKKEA